MNGFDSTAVPWLLLGLQILGVLIACAARISEGSSRQALCQRAFFGVLPLVGAATIVALAVGPGCWLTCSASLAVMVLMVTYDFRGSKEAATW